MSKMKVFDIFPKFSEEVVEQNSVGGAGIFIRDHSYTLHSFGCWTYHCTLFINFGNWRVLVTWK